MADSTHDARIWAGFLALIAGASIGSATGWLVSETGLDPEVVAAVLPVIVSGLGGLLGYSLARDKHASTIAIAVFLIVFSAALFIAAIATTEARARDASEKFRLQTVLSAEYRQVQLQQRLLQLRQCSEIEFKINRERQAAGLKPYSKDFVCDLP